MDKLLKELQNMERKSLEKPVPLGLSRRVTREAGLSPADLLQLEKQPIAVIRFTNLVIARRIRSRLRQEKIDCFFVIKDQGQLDSLVCLAEHFKTMYQQIEAAEEELATHRARILTANHRNYLRTRLPRIRDDLLALLCHYASFPPTPSGEPLPHLPCAVDRFLEHPEIYVTSKVVDALHHFLRPLGLSYEQIEILMEAWKTPLHQAAVLPKDFPEQAIHGEIRHQLDAVLSQIFRQKYPSMPKELIPWLCQFLWELFQKDEYDPYLKRKLGRGGLPELSWIAPLALNLYLEQAADSWQIPVNKAPLPAADKGLIRQVIDMPMKAKPAKRQKKAGDPSPQV